MNVRGVESAEHVARCLYVAGWEKCGEVVGNGIVIALCVHQLTNQQQEKSDDDQYD